ncbi:MAG: SPFH/Band 7/PHB domain protein [Erysipelotrichaceae bacterium]|nr:SPFH/Band 7/PHB domain protein [Erysipelotrichaceae bacterium]
MPDFIRIIIWVAVALIVLAIIVSCINIVPQQNAYVIERLGRYKATWDAGLHFKLPLVDRIVRRVLLKEQVADFAPQPVITKDNVTMQIDSVVYFRVMNPHDYAYGVENPIMAMENLTATTLRNIIGDMELDTTLTSRDSINSSMLQIIDQATDPWGIKVTRVELKNIQPPAAIREAMEKQMKAEREKRAAILTAEGEKQSMILTAEGKKESAVLEAEANKRATILAAEAQKEKEIKEAEGRAEAIRAVQTAQADGIRAIKEAGADDAVIRLKSLEAFQAAANGQATKIIVPSDIASLAGLAKSVTESMK